MEDVFLWRECTERFPECLVRGSESWAASDRCFVSFLLELTTFVLSKGLPLGLWLLMHGEDITVSPFPPRLLTSPQTRGAANFHEHPSYRCGM